MKTSEIIKFIYKNPKKAATLAYVLIMNAIINNRIIEDVRWYKEGRPGKGTWLKAIHAYLTEKE